MSEENNNAAPVIQDYKFSNIDDCVKYLNKDETINKKLNEYLQTQLSRGKYDVAQLSGNNFRKFKSCLVSQFVNKERIMKSKFDEINNPCPKFDEVILDFKTVYKVIKACCENRTIPFIFFKTSLLSFINEKDKDKKISCQHCVDFIGRFGEYSSCKSLDTGFINKILEITDVSSKEVDKSKNKLCIQDAIKALPDECFSMPNISELLNLIFSVQDFSLFSSNPGALYETIYSLIVKSEKYINGDQVGAIKDVLENGELYKKFRDELEKVGINFDMRTLIEKEPDLAMLLFANNFAVNIKNGKITIEERKPTPNELIFLLQEKYHYLDQWIAGVAGIKSYEFCDENIGKNQFKIDSFEKLQNVKVKLIKSYIEHSKNSEILKKAFKPLLDLEKSSPEEFNKLLNKIKLSDEAIQAVFRAIKLKDELTGEQFDDFKNTISNLCFGVDKPLLVDVGLLNKFGKKTLTSKQMEELLNLLELNQNNRIVSKGNEASPVLIWRLKDGEVLSKELLDYFYERSEYRQPKSDYVSEKNTADKFSVFCFCHHIWYTIIHSNEYINCKDNGKKAIETVLSSGKEYEPFRKYINSLVTYDILYGNGVTGKINLDKIYTKEYHTPETLKTGRSIVGKLVDLLDENGFKLTFDDEEGKLKLESTSPQLQKGVDINLEKLESQVPQSVENEVAGNKLSEQRELEKQKEEKPVEEKKEEKKNDSKDNLELEVKKKEEQSRKEIDKAKKEKGYQEQPNIENERSEQTNSEINQQNYKSQSTNSINIESQNKSKAENLSKNNVNSFEIIEARGNVKCENGKENEKNKFKNIEVIKNDNVNFSSEQKNNKSEQAISNISQFEIIGNIKHENSKENEEHRFKNIKIIQNDSVNFNAEQKIPDDVKTNNISKVLILTAVAVILSILGLLVLLNIIFPVVPVKESISAGIAILSFLASVVLELGSRWLSLKEQPKNIESMTKNPSNDITEENKYVYQVNKNKLPISNVLGEQIGENQKRITEK